MQGLVHQAQASLLAGSLEVMIEDVVTEAGTVAGPKVRWLNIAGNQFALLTKLYDLAERSRSAVLHPQM